MQASAPEVFALKVRPEASSALPLEQMPKNKGVDPTANGDPGTCALVAVLMTETVLPTVLVT